MLAGTGVSCPYIMVNVVKLSLATYPIPSFNHVTEFPWLVDAGVVHDNYWVGVGELIHVVKESVDKTVEFLRSVWVVFNSKVENPIMGESRKNRVSVSWLGSSAWTAANIKDLLGSTDKKSPFFGSGTQSGPTPSVVWSSDGLLHTHPQTPAVQGGNSAQPQSDIWCSSLLHVHSQQSVSQISQVNYNWREQGNE